VITANFAIDQHNVTVNVNDPDGGRAIGTGLYNYGDTVMLKAIANEHYSLTGWSNGETDTVIYVIVSGDTVVTANFTIDQHYVIVNVNDPDGGVATGSGIYNYGDTVMLKAIANEHYSLTGWSNGETDTVIYVIVSGDTVITANFTIDQHEVTTAVNDTALGSVTGAGTYDYGTTVTLTAIPVAHAEFTGWSNGETANPLNITLTSDTTVTANFILRSSVDDTEADNYVAYAGYNEIVVTGAADHTVAVYDMNGRLVKAIENAADIEHINVNVAGVYVIRVSNMTATRVVVK
ncbi:MAG: T9SS type A sorting domain-containing protein, partial [Paludibacteraceae bacterium]|nr:T9SS type A sorting domain-containing protein [Paludibacteraceae bacterium]